jgi:hypothetical protein
MILAESCDSGRDSRLRWQGENPGFIDHSRTISRRRKNMAPKFEIRPDMGLFYFPDGKIMIEDLEEIRRDV